MIYWVVYFISLYWYFNIIFESIMAQNRFTDQKKRISDFYTEALVVCPKCEKKALARVDYEAQQARLFCAHCGYNKVTSTDMSFYGVTGRWKIPANHYFQAELWLQYPFKDNVFYAYNMAHLEYLEQYISATLREHKDRTHFTLLEKLPLFYHEAKNREPLLKLIAKLKNK